jgi:hypothetical protein
MVGFFARFFIILAGLVSVIFVLVSGAVFMILWAFIPVALPVALILMVAGVGR